jgi:hypothetical protein
MIHLELVDFKSLFDGLAEPPIIANDFDTRSIEKKEELNKFLFTKYEGDALSVLPTCDCGKIKGGWREGEYCPTCKTKCQSVVERPVESSLWIRTPLGVSMFVNPTVWIILRRRLTTSNWSILDWLTDRYYQPPAGQAQPHWVKKIIRAEIPRGLNSFYQNFDKIMQILFCDGRPYEEILHMVEKEEKVWDFYDTVKMIHMYREAIFTPVLPIPSRVGFVVESNETGTYADKTITLAFNAMHTVISMDRTIRQLPMAGKESRTVKAMHQLCEFYETFAKETLSKKPGILRKHIFGIRLHFTARAVITSITEPHDYDELHVPWSVAIQLFHLHLMNKLYKLGYTQKQAEMFLRRYTFEYHPLLDQLFQELISQSPFGGIPCIFQRNPSLARGSAQLLYIKKVKTDPRINTFSLSVKILVGFNADFDGDELNLMMILDHEIHRALYPLSPHMSSLDVTKPRRLSSNLKLQPPVASTINNWLTRGLLKSRGFKVDG